MPMNTLALQSMLVNTFLYVPYKSRESTLVRVVRILERGNLTRNSLVLVIREFEFCLSHTRLVVVNRPQSQPTAIVTEQASTNQNKGNFRRMLNVLPDYFARSFFPTRETISSSVFKLTFVQFSTLPQVKLSRSIFCFTTSFFPHSK